jgi:hypothetical protein
MFCIQVLTQDGGKCSSSLDLVSLPISRTIRYSLSRIERMKKLNQLSWITK